MKLLKIHQQTEENQNPIQNYKLNKINSLLTSEFSVEMFCWHPAASMRPTVLPVLAKFGTVKRPSPVGPAHPRSTTSIRSMISKKTVEISGTVMCIPKGLC